MSIAQTYKPFYRPEKWLTDLKQHADRKRLSLYKLKISDKTSVLELKRLHTQNNITMLTHLSYNTPSTVFDSYLILLLRKIKNLKYLTIDLGYRAERIEYGTLFRIGSLMKLKSLKITYKQSEYGSSAAFLNNLMKLLQRLSTLESLKLKFVHAFFTQGLHLIPRVPRTLPLHNLTSLELDFAQIHLDGVDNWMVSFGQAVGKALSRNLPCPKIISLAIGKEDSGQLTPSGISNFLACFDQIHLTNSVSLKILTGGLRIGTYTDDPNNRVKEEYPYSTFKDLFFMFIKRHQAKFILQTLKINVENLGRYLEGFIREKPTLLINNLHLLVAFGWNAVEFQEDMSIARLFQPQKEIKIDFEDRFGHIYEHLFDIVLTPMLSKVTKNDMSVCLDFTYTNFFDRRDSELLCNVFENTHKQISYLDLILPGANEEMNEEDMMSAMVKVVYSMSTVKTCVVNLNQLDLKLYKAFYEVKEVFTVNKKCSIEKLILRLEKTNVKSEVVLQILRLVGQIPRLESIDVICTKEVYRTCKSAQVIQANSFKNVLCKFIVEGAE